MVELGIYIPKCPTVCHQLKGLEKFKGGWERCEHGRQERKTLKRRRKIRNCGKSRLRKRPEYSERKRTMAGKGRSKLCNAQSTEATVLIQGRGPIRVMG